MSEFDEESVLAMKIDPKDSYLLAGDTAGFIAIFDIKNYCTSPQSTVSRFNTVHIHTFTPIKLLLNIKIVSTLSPRFGISSER